MLEFFKTDDRKKIIRESFHPLSFKEPSNYEKKNLKYYAKEGFDKYIHRAWRMKNILLMPY